MKKQQSPPSSRKAAAVKTRRHPLLARLAFAQADGESLRLQGLVQAYNRALQAAPGASLKKAKLRVALRRVKAQLRARLAQVRRGQWVS